MFWQGSATPRTASRPRPKRTNGLCDELRLQLQNPPPETHKEISEGQHFHPTLPSEADPGAIVGENNRRRHPDPVGMLKCQPESKMCVCSGCVRCIIVAFLTGWSCRTWAALAALKSPRRTARGCVTDDLGAAGGGASGAGIRQRSKDVLGQVTYTRAEQPSGPAAHIT